MNHLNNTQFNFVKIFYSKILTKKTLKKFWGKIYWKYQTDTGKKFRLGFTVLLRLDPAKLRGVWQYPRNYVKTKKFFFFDSFNPIFQTKHIWMILIVKTLFF